MVKAVDFPYFPASSNKGPGASVTVNRGVDISQHGHDTVTDSGQLGLDLVNCHNLLSQPNCINSYY